MTLSFETQHLERKSLRLVTGKGADFGELAKDCVCFANGAGGVIHVGIEDGATRPPPEQRIEVVLLDQLRKRVGELTVNVAVEVAVERDPNGGEFVVMHVPRAVGVASTKDGRFYVRVGDSCQPILGDDVMRLAAERPAIPWETMTSLGVPQRRVDRALRDGVIRGLRSSDRVKDAVKEKSDDELIVHYGLAVDGVLTNLGVLLVGTAADRARLGSAPVVQAIKYDEFGKKVAKESWDDHTLSPVALIDAIWGQLPDFRESYEVPDGMFRAKVPAFEEAVVRELLVNALVHRPYTQGGDIFLNLRPESLEVVNPGRLPLGVTPRNILHTTRRRNEGLARIFHDLRLMEREGTGIDLLFDRLLASGRGAPSIEEKGDSVRVTIPRRVLHPGVVRLVAEADQRFQLAQRERIVFALLAQSEGLSAIELCAQLEIEDAAALRPWLGRLPALGLVEQSGRTKATRYFVPPGLLRGAGLDARTTLNRVQPHRLVALVLEDLRRYPASSRGEIHRRIGPEINAKSLSRALTALCEEGEVLASGKGRWRTYELAPARGHGRGINGPTEPTDPATPRKD